MSCSTDLRRICLFLQSYRHMAGILQLSCILSCRYFPTILQIFILYISLSRAFIDIDILHIITLLFSHSFPTLPSPAMKLIPTICTKGYFMGRRQLSALPFPCRGKPQMHSLHAFCYQSPSFFSSPYERCLA